jgi:ribosome-associated translation inhibitor RaiA
MQTPAQIEFEGVEASAELKSAIDQLVAKLETRFDRVTVGRIVVRGAGERHQTGGQYQVTICLTLPDGRAVNVARTPTEDERYADLSFAINDAFKRARRQLQDEARLMRGDVKHHVGR